MEHDNSYKNLIFLRPYGGRRKERPNLKWEDGVEENLLKLRM